MKNKCVHNCKFVHHANNHYIMTMLKSFFETEIQGWGLKLKFKEVGGKESATLRDSIAVDCY